MCYSHIQSYLRRYYVLKSPYLKKYNEYYRYPIPA